MNTIAIRIATPILAGLSISLAQAAPPGSSINTIGQLNCSAGEVAMYDGAKWLCADVAAPLQDALDALTARVNALESENQALEDRLACVTSTSDASEFVLEGCNVHVRNGAGQTDSINGVGNLIVGYDEERSLDSDKTGSHNMVIGDNHNYNSYGGLVAGSQNTISGSGASITGGSLNTASGELSSVNGGGGNVASTFFSSVSGGVGNTSSGNGASVSGGNLCEVAIAAGWGVGARDLTSGCIRDNAPSP